MLHYRIDAAATFNESWINMMKIPNSRTFNLLFSSLVCIVACAGTLAAQAQNKSFSYGGFQLNMTADDLQKSFPHSVVEKSNGMNYVRIAKEDIKDGATAGMIYLHKGKNYAVHLLFEFPRDPKKPDSYYRNPFNQNPPCEPTLAAFTKQYGKPYGPLEGGEEALRYDEYVWDNADEKLILTCARFAEKKSKKTWLAQIRIAHNRPGSCMHSACVETPQ